MHRLVCHGGTLALVTTLSACGLVPGAARDRHDDPAPDLTSTSLLPVSGALACAAIDAWPAAQLRATAARDEYLTEIGCPAAGLTGLGQRGEELIYRRAGFGEPVVVPTSPDGGDDLRSLRQDAAGMLTLAVGQAQPELIFSDDSGESERRLPVQLPRRQRAELTTGLEGLETLCYSRDPVLYDPDFYIQSRMDLRPTPDGSGYVTLIATCGYVDLVFLNADGTRRWTETIFDAQGKTPQVLLPVYAELSVGAPAEGITVVVRNKPRWYDQQAAEGLELTIGRFNYDGTRRAFVQALKVETKVGLIMAVAAAGDDVVVLGTAYRDIDGGPNDTDEDDVWLARIDPVSGIIRAESTVDNDKDDIPRALAVTAGGDIYVAGETAKHHVDTGSWDNGAKSLLMRYNGQLQVQERLVFGDGRMNRALQLLIGTTQIGVAGLWDGTPSNHSGPAESWWRSFVVAVPRSGWADLTVTTAAEPL